MLPFLAVGVWVPQFLGDEEAPARPVDDLLEEEEDDDPVPVLAPAPAAGANTRPAAAPGTGTGPEPGTSNELVDSLVASLQSLEALTRTGAEPRLAPEDSQVTFATEVDPVSAAPSLRVNALDWIGVDTELTAVLHGSSGSLAMLGGRIVREGDAVSGDVRVLEIGRDWVRLEHEGETRRIELRGFEVNNGAARAIGGDAGDAVVDDELLVDEGF